MSHAALLVAGRYRLLEPIGSGAMSSVWRAWDSRAQSFVAAKVLAPGDGSMLLRFVREQSVRIPHPHVVAPSGWAADDDLVVLTMDLVGGGSLDQLLLRHGPLPASYVAVLLDQLLQALDAVHGAGVVHRDVKPANLLLEVTGTGRPHLRLGDFGIATPAGEVRLTQVPGGVGTDGYCSPEQGAGAAPEPRQDLYAAGVVAIELLTGLRPRRDLPQVPPPPGPLRPMLEALTSASPADRPPSAGSALAWLRRIGVPLDAPWQSTPHPPDVVDLSGQGATRHFPTGTGLTSVVCFLATIGLCAATVALLAGSSPWAPVPVTGASLTLVGGLAALARAHGLTRLPGASNRMDDRLGDRMGPC